MAFRTITKADEPGYAESEWQGWLTSGDPHNLTMLPLVECVRRSDPERVDGLAKHLDALSNEIAEGHGTFMDCDAFRGFINAACAESVQFANMFSSATNDRPWETEDHSYDRNDDPNATTKNVVLNKSLIAMDVGQRLNHDAWNDTGKRVAATRSQLLTTHQKIITNPTVVGVPVHPPHTEFRLYDDFLYRVLPDANIHVARVLHHVGYFAYALF